MKNPLVLLGGAIVLLLLVGLVSGVFDDEVSTLQVEELTIESDQVTKVEINSTDLALSLENDGGTWVIISPGRFASDTVQVNRFLENLASLQPDILITENPEKHSKYEVAEDEGKSVRIYDSAGILANLIIGKNGPDPRSVYMRKADDNAVYLSDGTLTFPTDVNAWRDKTIIALNPLQINAVAVRTQEEQYQLVQSGSGWEIIQDEQRTPADSAAVARLLTQLSQIRADGFLGEERPSTVLESENEELALQLNGTGTFSLTLQMRENEYAAVSNQSTDVYKLFTYRKNALLPAVESLRVDSD